LKNEDNKHVNDGSSECPVILNVMYRSNFVIPETTRTEPPNVDNF
ncbi:hypothetical protein T03_7014, partial [Trichinella britovi]